MIKIFTIPFSIGNETFFEDELNQFLPGKKVKILKPEFFNFKENFYWTVFVDYDPVVKTDMKSEMPIIKLDEADELLYKHLKAWRRETAEKEGIPVYIVATNAQFLEIVKLKPKTKEALKKVKGCGKKKIEKYGDDILKIVAGFK